MLIMKNTCFASDAEAAFITRYAAAFMLPLADLLVLYFSSGNKSIFPLVLIKQESRFRTSTGRVVRRRSLIFFYTF